MLLTFIWSDIKNLHLIAIHSCPEEQSKLDCNHTWFVVGSTSETNRGTCWHLYGFFERFKGLVIRVSGKDVMKRMEKKSMNRLMGKQKAVKSGSPRSRGAQNRDVGDEWLVISRRLSDGHWSKVPLRLDALVLTGSRYDKDVICVLMCLEAGVCHCETNSGWGMSAMHVPSKHAWFNKK